MSGVSHWTRTRRGVFRPVRTLPLTDRGFRYGMAVFETIGVWHGWPVFLEEHLERAYQGSVRSAFPVEMPWLRQAGEHLCSVLGPEDAGVARLHITAGDGGPADPVTRSRVILSFERRAPITTEVLQRGYRLVTCPDEFLPTLNGRKTHNYWLNLDALVCAKAAGADEGIVVGPGGVILSACMANLFLVSSEGSVVTPSLGNGPRAGVIREWVLRQHNVQEALLHRTDLATAREAFITSSWLGVMPVAGIDGRIFEEKTVSNNFMQKYQCYLRDSTLQPAF